MNKKLYNLLKFSILAVEKTVKILFSIMYNFTAKFAKILETSKKFSTNLVEMIGFIVLLRISKNISDQQIHRGKIRDKKIGGMVLFGSNLEEDKG